MNGAKLSPFILLMISALLLLGYVLLFTPKLPIGDQWDSIVLQEDQAWSNVLIQVNQHRTIMPNLIVLILARATSWNLLAEAVASLALLVALVFSIYCTFIKLVNNHTAKFIFGLVMLTQMTPIHHENILWVFSGILFSSLTVFWALVAVGVLTKTSLAVILLITAQFSFLSGLLGWLPVAFIIWKRNKLTIWFLLVFAGVSLVYFLGYHAPEVRALPASCWLRVAFFLVYFGAFLVPTYRVGIWLWPLLWVVGTLGLGFLCLGAYLVAKTRSSNKAEIIIPQAMLIFAILIAGVTAMGRAGQGLELALLSRYHVFQMFYFVGVAWLGLIYLMEQKLIDRYSCLIVISMIVLTCFNWVSGIGLGYFKWRKFHPIAIELKAKGEKISEASARLIYTDTNHLRNKIKKLKKMSYGIFRN